MTQTLASPPKRETACWGEVSQWRGRYSMDSDDIWHRRCRPGNGSSYQMTARISIEQPTGSDAFHAVVREELLRTEAPNRGALEVTWYESPEFPTLRDAQLFADWAITRWHSEERWSAAGFDWVDLDPQGNPWA